MEIGTDIGTDNLCIDVGCLGVFKFSGGENILH
jgi:hypothetical protein